MVEQTDQIINEDANTGALAFTVGDVETAVASLTVSGTSSNTTLVPNASIVFGGSGANRTVTATPAANQNGKAFGLYAALANGKGRGVLPMNSELRSAICPRNRCEHSTAPP